MVHSSAASLLFCAVANLLPTSSAFTSTLRQLPTRTILHMTESTSLSSSTTTQACAAVENPPPTKTAAAVIFDIDGTLADSWKLGYDATVVVLEQNELGHVPINEEIYHATCVYPTPERLARTAGLVPGDDQFESLGNDLAQQFDDYYVQLVSPETCAFYEGILELLEHLPEETKLGALTNACVAYGHAVLEANCPVKRSGQTKEGMFSLYDRFGTINGADSVPAAKPSPEGLLQCAKELGVKPEDCIYVGDAVGDGKAARAAGMVSIGVLWGSNSEEKLRNAETFDYICSTREQLRDLLPQQ
jgi:phosphoglycolate phosphatase-like HAD superfamily hydrolase